SFCPSRLRLRRSGFRQGKCGCVAGPVHHESWCSTQFIQQRKTLRGLTPHSRLFVRTADRLEITKRAGAFSGRSGQESFSDGAVDKRDDRAKRLARSPVDWSCKGLIATASATVK